MSLLSRSSRLGVIAFFVLWMLVLTVPLSRAIWQLQIAGLSQNVQYIGLFAADFHKIRQRFPDDVQLDVATAEHESDYGFDTQTGKPLAAPADFRALTKGYDGVIARHPREAWLYANWLTHVARFRFVPPAKQDEDSSTAYSELRQLRPEELRRALQVAEQGAQLDPQNSFYDWMRAAALFGLNRDAEALHALEMGAYKPHFDDGTLTWMHAQTHAYDVAGYPLWEERLGGALTPTSHLAVIRSVGRAAMFHALQARQHNDWQGAWRTYDAVQHISATMCHEASTIVGVLVGQAVLQMVWRSAVLGPDVFKQAKPLQSGEQKPKLITAPQFAPFARQHGRADLAAFALRTYNAFDKKQSVQLYTNNFAFSGVPKLDAQTMLRANEIGGLLLNMLFPCLGLWLVAGTALWWRGPRPASLARLDVAASVGFCLPLMLFGLGYIWRWYGNTEAGSVFGDGENRDEALEQHIASLGTLLPWVAPVLGGVYGLVASLWRQRVLRMSESEDYDVDSYVLAIRPRWATIGFRGIGYLLTVTGVYWFTSFVLDWLNGSSTYVGPYHPPLLAIPPMILLRSALLAIPLVLLLRWLGERWQFSAKTASLRWRAVEWHWRTMGAFALLLSMAYAGFTWSTIPARVRAADSFNHYVTQGETQCMRQLVAQSAHAETSSP